ncbi:DUF5819 family protein [Kitasatospora aureofaciens]|uniref:DUF5819 family protein n=1 Tax=Kitasatospora aureofaciens TaxID=1894 RepID=UPI0036F44F83
MGRTGRSRTSNDSGSVGLTDSGLWSADEENDTAVEPADRPAGGAPGSSAECTGQSRLLRTVTASGVALCVTTALVHVLLVFLYVAPSNQISQHYSKQINAWIYPFFEQNWRLFAPNPESVSRQISARTETTSSNGSKQVSDWFDLTAVDSADVEHNIFPSHTTQNMLRRAWTSYLETHGGDDRSYSARAAMFQKYLRNIAVERVSAHQPGPFQAIQLRVTTQPIAGSPHARGPYPAAKAPVETRYLPLWKVTPNGN